MKYQLAIRALIAFERNVVENFIGTEAEAARRRKSRESKQNGSRCDFVSTLRDPQPCSIREIFAYPPVQDGVRELQSRRAAARTFLQGRELWRYDTVRAYMSLINVYHEALLLARDISSSSFRTIADSIFAGKDRRFCNRYVITTQTNRFFYTDSGSRVLTRLTVGNIVDYSL